MVMMGPMSAQFTTGVLRKMKSTAPNAATLHAAARDAGEILDKTKFMSRFRSRIAAIFHKNPSGFHEITHGISLLAHLKCHQRTVNRHQGMPKVMRRNLLRSL
jgi:hypothetical protein